MTSGRRAAVLLVLTGVLTAALLGAPATGGTSGGSAEAASPGCGLQPVLCVDTEAVAGDASGAAGAPEDSAFAGIATELRDAAGKVLQTTLAWWLTTPSVSLERSGALGVQAVLGVVVTVLMMLLLLWQAAKMALSRKGEHLVSAVSGLATVAVVGAVGVAAIDAALLAGDRVAEAILGVGAGDAGKAVARLVDVCLSSGLEEQAPALVAVFALLVLLVGLVQAVALFLRQTGVPVLGAVLQLAAAGRVGGVSTQHWLPRVISTILAIVLYKPVVAIVLSVGIAQVGDGTTFLDAIRGAVTLVLSVIALPTMLRVLDPLSESVAGRSGAALAVMAVGAPAAAVTADPTWRGAGAPGATSAVQQAAFMEGRVGLDGGSSGPSGSGGSGGGSGPSAPGGSEGVAARSPGPVPEPATGPATGPVTGPATGSPTGAAAPSGHRHPPIAPPASPAEYPSAPAAAPAHQARPVSPAPRDGARVDAASPPVEVTTRVVEVGAPVVDATVAKAVARRVGDAGEQ